jgi:hypothetical protein
MVEHGSVAAQLALAADTWVRRQGQKITVDERPTLRSRSRPGWSETDERRGKCRANVQSTERPSTR